MLKPRALGAGSRVALVAPASPFTREAFDLGIAELTRLGLEPVYDASVFATEGSYLAGTAALRAEAFLRAWEDPAVSGLLAVRGGYGSAQLLPLLPRARLRATPKLFVGYSDNTALLSFLTCQCGITTLHGPMLDGRLAVGEAAYHRPSFEALIGGHVPLALEPDALRVVRAGAFRGRLYGGNLSVLAASCGTPYACDPPPGCVLFLEDVNERPYRLDRLLTQLGQAGVLARAGALVFGEMRGCDERSGAVRAHDVIARVAEEFGGPVLTGFPSGHTTGSAWSLPFGVDVTVEAVTAPRIIIEESPVG
ncbi:MAG: LD-carboxypeptidase [Vicinamibacterales bacterium]